MRRITDLDNMKQIEILNELTNSPKEYITEFKNGKRRINVNHYLPYRALGIYNLCRVSTDGGGESTIFYASNNREFYDKITAINNFLRFELKSFTPVKRNQNGEIR